jgi:myo-inositol-1(or 4)-monophosphatase
LVQSTLESACEAARSAGRVLLEHLGKAEVHEKGKSDLVTNADLAAQRTIEKLLTNRFPQIAFMGEESTEEIQSSVRTSGKLAWVVDPLDGTTNFVHRLPSFAVSIALVEGQNVKLGVVYDPLAGTLYTASENGPATRDGKPIRASVCAKLDKAMVCCSFPPGVTRADRSVQQFLCVLEQSQSLRRLGSAALNLCYLAEGCLDSYWASSVKVWDVAAGYLIAKQAGVTFNNVDGGAFDVWNPQLLASSTSELQAQMLRCLHSR